MYLTDVSFQLTDIPLQLTKVLLHKFGVNLKKIERLKTNVSHRISIALLRQRTPL